MCTSRDRVQLFRDVLCIGVTRIFKLLGGRTKTERSCYVIYAIITRNNINCKKFMDNKKNNFFNVRRLGMKNRRNPMA